MPVLFCKGRKSLMIFVVQSHYNVRQYHFWFESQECIIRQIAANRTMKGMSGTQLGIYWPNSNCAYYNNELPSHSSIKCFASHSGEKKLNISVYCRVDNLGCNCNSHLIKSYCLGVKIGMLWYTNDLWYTKDVLKLDFVWCFGSLFSNKCNLFGFIIDC